MTFEFKNLTEEEKNMLFQIENEYPNDLVVSEVVAGFDGQSVLQIIGITADMLTLGASFYGCVNFLLDQRKHKLNNKVPMTVIFDDGTWVKVNSITELVAYINDSKNGNRP